jgi:transposase
VTVGLFTLNRTEEDAVPNATRLSRGDRRRNEKLRRLRALVRRDLAICAVDLADARQAAVVADHDSCVLGRRMFAGSAWVADQILDWAEALARQAGFAGVVLACEPTGQRWKPLLQVASARGVGMVCVQPLLVHRAREGEDFTKDRSDFKDATLIARLTGELRCYRPLALEGQWARLRHLGQRRDALLVKATAARQALRDLLECAWPAVLQAARQPLESLTWRAAMSVSLEPEHIAGMGYARFCRAVARALRAQGGTRRSHRVMRAVFQAARMPGGIVGERAAALERATFSFADWQRALGELAEVERRMVGVLEALGLRELVESVPGLSALGGAAILAQTADPALFDTPRTWVKHAGLCPRANESGAFRGQTTVSGRGRPALRSAAWRAIWGLLPHNPRYAARYRHLTQRGRNPLSDGQARAALAAALLRQLHVIVTQRVAWDPARAAGREVVPLAA